MAVLVDNRLWLDILMVLVSVAMLLCFVRLYIGPTTPNRTVAFDMIAVNAVGLLVFASIRFDEPTLLDAAVITAVLGFLGTVMLAYFIERSPYGGEEDDTP
jgi:multicomponent Na+:H+ antiporter subunit F